jgi:hypothetical protein
LAVEALIKAAEKIKARKEMEKQKTQPSNTYFTLGNTMGRFYRLGTIDILYSFLTVIPGLQYLLMLNRLLPRIKSKEIWTTHSFAKLWLNCLLRQIIN